MIRLWSKFKVVEILWPIFIRNMIFVLNKSVSLIFCLILWSFHRVSNFWLPVFSFVSKILLPFRNTGFFFRFVQSLKIVWASLAPISRFGPNGLIGRNALILVLKRIKVRLWVTEPANVQVPSVNLKWWNKQGHVQNVLVGLPGQRTSLIALRIHNFIQIDVNLKSTFL